MANYTNSSNATDPLQTATPVEYGNRYFMIFLVTAEIIIAIVSLVSNFLVVYAFVAYKKLRTSVTNYFVISLAISDILTSGLVTAFKADMNSKRYLWTHGLFMCHLYTTMFLLALPSSVINLCAVTVDRYLVLRMPLRYTTLMPPRRAVGIICFLWIYAIVWSCLPILGWNVTNGASVLQNGYCYHSSTNLYNNLMNVLNFLFPMVFMAIFWVLIYSIVRKHRKRVLKIERSLSRNTNDSSNSSNNTNGEVHAMTQLTARNEKTEEKRLRRNVRGSRFIGFIVVLFYFCWLPYVSLSVIGNICVSCMARVPPILYEVFLALGFLNSALNPFLYPFHDKHFKAAFKDMWKKLRGKAISSLLQSHGKGAVFI